MFSYMLSSEIRIINNLSKNKEVTYDYLLASTIALIGMEKKHFLFFSDSSALLGVFNDSINALK